jgi:hypothetical protein
VLGTVIVVCFDGSRKLQFLHKTDDALASSMAAEIAALKEPLEDLVKHGMTYLEAGAGNIGTFAAPIVLNTSESTDVSAVAIQHQALEVRSKDIIALN